MSNVSYINVNGHLYPFDDPQLTEEVENIRIGADGKQYGSAGDALRSQLDDINDGLETAQNNITQIDGEQDSEKEGVSQAQGNITTLQNDASALATDISNTNSGLAPAFSESVTYAIGDYCMHNGTLYKAVAEHTGAWTDADFEAVPVGGELEAVNAETAEAQEITQIVSGNKMGALIDTASGSIASFYPDSTVPTVKGLSVDIEPVQDLHGYDSPWPAGGGKNLFNYENTGITLASMGQSGSVFSNTNTDSRTFFNFQFRALNNGTVVVTSDAQSISSTGRKSATITISETITHVSIVHNGSQRNLSVIYPFTGQGTFTISFDVTAYNPSSVGGLSFKDVQIESGSTATAYAPYSNICPISGWDAVEVKHSGADMTNPTTYTIQLGQTVYGGTLDVINGVLTVDRAMFTFTGAESFIENTAAWGAYAKLHNAGVAILSSVTNERTISSHFERSSGGGWGSLTAGLFMTAGGTFIGIGFDGSISELQAYLASQYSAGTPVQVVALLATPITVDLTPIEVAVLTGQTNNVWADSGDVSVEYAADLKTYINNKIAAAVAALS